MLSRLSLFLLVVSLGMAGGAIPPARVASHVLPAVQTAHASREWSSRATLLQSTEPPPDPIGQGCGGVTPPGETPPSCCIGGQVYLDGQAVAGAEVRVESAHGMLTTLTQMYSGAETQPSYRLSLSAEPLSVLPGEPITVTAGYAGHAQLIHYIAEAGGQHGQLVLPRNQYDDYAFMRQIRVQGDLLDIRGVAVDPGDLTYALDSLNAHVLVFDANGLPLEQWGSSGSQTGQLKLPRGIALDASGNVYIADTNNHRVQRFDAHGLFLGDFGGPGVENGQLSFPWGVAVDTAGNVYVADTGNNRVQKFSNTGSFLAAWGSLGTGNGQFDGPSGIAADTGGNIYVADTGNNRVQKFHSGAWLASWGGDGFGDGLLRGPYGLALDSHQQVYVADAGNNRAQVFRPMSETHPIATIMHILSDIVGVGDTLTIAGMGQDSDTTAPITAYRWTSDRQGAIGSSATLVRAASSLAPGSHRLSFDVRDSQGLWSAPVTIDISVDIPHQLSLPLVVR